MGKDRWLYKGRKILGYSWLGSHPDMEMHQQTNASHTAGRRLRSYQYNRTGEKCFAVLVSTALNHVYMNYTACVLSPLPRRHKVFFHNFRVQSNTYVPRFPKVYFNADFEPTCCYASQLRCQIRFVGFISYQPFACYIVRQSHPSRFNENALLTLSWKYFLLIEEQMVSAGTEMFTFWEHSD